MAENSSTAVFHRLEGGNNEPEESLLLLCGETRPWTNFCSKVGRPVANSGSGPSLVPGGNKKVNHTCSMILRGQRRIRTGVGNRTSNSWAKFVLLHLEDTKTSTTLVPWLPGAKKGPAEPELATGRPTQGRRFVHGGMSPPTQEKNEREKRFLLLGDETRWWTRYCSQVGRPVDNSGSVLSVLLGGTQKTQTILFPWLPDAKKKKPTRIGDGNWAPNSWVCPLRYFTAYAREKRLRRMLPSRQWNAAMNTPGKKLPSLWSRPARRKTDQFLLLFQTAKTTSPPWTSAQNIVV